jgi:hypothetical protein
MRGEDMDEQGMQVRLHEILDVIMFSDADELEAFGLSTEFRPDRVETFEQAGLLTRDKGLVVNMGDAEFQLTIVRSK